MNIYDFAMKKEQEGKDFYLEMAAAASKEGFRRILTRMAQIEERHLQVVRAMKDSAPLVEPTGILDEAKTVFQEFRDSGACFDCSDDEKGLYRKARDMEQEARDFYREQAEKVTDPAQRELFHKLKEEEHRHYILMDNILELLERPETWLEDAEWNNMDVY